MTESSVAIVANENYAVSTITLTQLGANSMKRMILPSACLILLLHPLASSATENGLAPAPPMGWNGWNAFNVNVNEALIKQTADAMVKLGLKDLGYTYINLDDGWMATERDSAGNLIANKEVFPDGIKAVADYVHHLGLKIGIYEDAGTETCKGFPGSYGHYEQDAKTFDSWGIDYVKYDWCHVPDGSDPQTLYTQISNAIANSGRPMVLSICNWGYNSPWTWAPNLSNLWRTTPDIQNKWASVLYNYRHNALLSSYAGPNHWNDPDLLEVGNGVLTPVEEQAHFSLWAEMAAPLIISTDVSSISKTDKEILTNKDVIAIDQDTLGVQGQVIRSDGSHDVLAKPLSNGDVSVVLFNGGNKVTEMYTTTAEIGLSQPAAYVLYNVWDGSSYETTQDIEASVPPHGVVMFRVHKGHTGDAAPLTTLSMAQTQAKIKKNHTLIVTERLTNHSDEPVNNLTFSLVVPPGWKAVKLGRNESGVPGGGKTAHQSWLVSAKDPRKAQTVQLTGRATYTFGATKIHIDSQNAETITIS